MASYYNDTETWNSSYNPWASDSYDSLYNSTSLWGYMVQLPGTAFTDHYTVAYLVFSFLAFFGILYALLTYHDYEHDYKPDSNLRAAASRPLRWSMTLMLVFYILQISDIFLHEEGILVKEGYFFTMVFRDALWQLVDYSIPMIISRVTFYQFPKWGVHPVIHSFWRFTCMLFLIVLLFLAIYRWSVSTAYIILALNGVTYSWTIRLAIEAAKLSAAYQSVYLLFSTLILVLTAFFLVRRTRLHEKLDIIEGTFLAIVLIFWIRSIVRADIVVKYTLDGDNRPDYLIAVSELLYGLPTVLLYILLNLLNKPYPISAVQSDILREGRRIAKREFTRRRVDASNNGPALPTPSHLLAEMESSPLSYLPGGIDNKLQSMPAEEVRTLLSRHIEDVLKLREKI